MKYHYAHNADGQTVSIQSLTFADRHQPFTCPGCDAALLPRMGQRVAWHFAHWPGAVCSPETYLHKVGKETFLKVYLDRLASGQPFWIEFYRRACGRCGERALTQLDLTTVYPAIGMERPLAGFIPDLVLGTDEELKADLSSVFVEIRVTHGCSPEKLASGRRIIEIALRDEQDLKPILAGCLRESWRVSLLGREAEYAERSPEGGEVRFYHFPRQVSGPAACGCRLAGARK